MKTIITTYVAVALILLPISSSAQCPVGQVEVTVDVLTDSYGFDCFWDLTPAGNGCGNGALFTFGNTTEMNCLSGGSQTASAGNGYGDNMVITENLGCMTIGNCYDINYVDDYGDGGISFYVYMNGIFIPAYQFIGYDPIQAFSFCVVTPPQYDAEMHPDIYEYSMVPLSQVGNIVSDGLIYSMGSDMLTGAYMSVSVLHNGNPVYSTNSAPQTINAGSAGFFNVWGYTPTAIGSYEVIYTAAMNETDQAPYNNETSYTFLVTDSIYARDNGINDMPVSLGEPGYMGNSFEITHPINLSSVSVLIDNGAGDITGNTFLIEVFASDGLTPTTSLATTHGTISNLANQWYTLAISPALSLPAGDFIVSLQQDASYYQQIGSSVGVFTPGTVWYSTTSTPWANVETIGGNISFMIRANLNGYASLATNENNEILTYPNPVQNELNIANIKAGTIIEVYNNLGQLVISAVATNNLVTLDLSILENGFYSIRTINGTESMSTKFIKN